jgi:hypothetical protein
VNGQVHPECVGLFAISHPLASQAQWLKPQSQDELSPEALQLDDRFHGSCHNRGIHLWFQAPYMWRGGVEAKD